MRLQPLERLDPRALEVQGRFLPQFDRPFVISGAALTWPAISTLQLNELKVHFGSARIPVRESDDEFEMFFRAGPSRVGARKMMDLSAYIDLIQPTRENGQPRPPYAGNISILHDPAVAKTLAGILAACRFPGSFPDQQEEFRLWIGASGQRSSIHNDPYDNFNAQIVGRKHFLVFAPNQHAALYPLFLHVGLWASPVDPQKPDPGKFPKFETAEGFECELVEGDILYLPRFWWHSADARAACVNVNRWVFSADAESRWWHQQEEAQPWISHEALLHLTRRQFEALPSEIKEFRRAEFNELEADLTRLKRLKQGRSPEVH